MVLGNSVDPDLQLAFLGLINKIMDLLLTKALQITAGVIVTLWMTRSRRSSGARGARLADFELSEEFTKPWAALSQFTKRWSNNGWKGAGKTRFLITLSISVCVLLQGLAVNTIGVPKQRWWPESLDALNVSHPLCNLRSLDWMNFWDSSWGTVGGGDISWDVMASYIATSSHLAFRDFATKMDSNPRGWQDFRPENSGAFVALDTRHNGPSTRGFALHTSQAVDAFTWMQTNGTADARRASGISAELKLTVPGTLVSCRTSDLRPSLDANALSVTVDKPPNTLAGATNFSINLLSANTNSEDFESATCEVHFHRMVFPASIWIIDGASTADASVNGYGKKYDIETEILPFAREDSEMADSLASQFEDTATRLEQLSQSMSSSQWLMRIAQEVRRRRPEYVSNVEALAPTIALLTNHLLTIANWTTNFSDIHLVESKSVRWQLFGSGPRLPWEWVTAAVLGILILSLVTSLALSLYYMIVPGEWLKAGGMLVAANCSPPIVVIKDSINNPRGELENIRVRVSQVANAGTAGTVDVAALVNAKDGGDSIDYGARYQWRGPS